MTKHDHPIVRRARIHFRNGHSIHPVSQEPDARLDRLERRVADLERRLTVRGGPVRTETTLPYRQGGRDA